MEISRQLISNALDGVQNHSFQPFTGDPLMRMPSFKKLAKDIERNGYQSRFCATFMNPNPRLYKYYWWVFWQGSPCDSEEFLSDRYRMPIKQAFELIHKLEEERQQHWVYNRRLPRLDPVNTAFDPSAEIWRDTEWALPFDEDTDEEYQGFK